MNINCIICSNLFEPNSDIYVTTCGHIFHHICLIQWIGRSQTCPQCRSRTTEKTICRVFYNIVTSDNITDDPVTLQNKLDNVNLEIKLKDKEVKDLESNLKKSEEDHDALKEQYQNVSEKASKYEDEINSLRDNMIYYKEKAKNEEILLKELKMTKERLTTAERVTNAINGSFEDVQIIVNECQCPKTLSSIAMSLKKELQSMEKKRNVLFTALKRKETELIVCKKENEEMKEEKARLNMDLKAHQQCEAEIQILKKKILEVENASTENLHPTLQRVLHESPAPLLGKSNTNADIYDDIVEIIDSPTVVVSQGK